MRKVCKTCVYSKEINPHRIQCRRHPRTGFSLDAFVDDWCGEGKWRGKDGKLYGWTDEVPKWVEGGSQGTANDG